MAPTHIITVHVAFNYIESEALFLCAAAPKHHKCDKQAEGVSYGL